ncbi:MAG: cation-translocating P-type ATPase family protein, partial [Planctomycetes bacterium]|nr:cation-translocating P-type ATPase family protein [Planctomycetota bacterium]
VRAVYGFDLAMLLALVGGLPIYLGVVNSLVRGKITADLAVTLAAFAALWIGQYAVAAEVIFIMLIGGALENFAIGRTRSGIASLLALCPHEARVLRHGHEHVVPVDEIHPDDLVILRPGDRVPVDGRVIRGSSSIDQSAITGESLPADKAAGDEVFAGTLNLNGALEVAVERLSADTTLERIIHLVEHAEATKAPVQRLADRYATWFVPAVLVIAALVYWWTGAVVRSVAVLVIACPCALVLATPTAIAAGIGRLACRGVLVSGGNVLEQIGRLRSVVFDKTGTLTLARLRVSRTIPAPGQDEAEVLRLAASVERHSEHLVGQLIVEEANRREIPLAEATGFLAHPGLGAEATVDGQRVRVGNPRFITEGVALPPEFGARIDEAARHGCTVVLVARGGQVAGAIAVEDTVRPEAHAAIHDLRHLGIDRIAMLTGDNEAAARSVARAVGLDDVRSGLLPADKVEAIRKLQGAAGSVAMVGDGINDAPSLVAADVGVAMADIGTDVAIASAGLILVGGDLRKLPEALALGRRALRIIRQNIIGFALVFNVVTVAGAAVGWIAPVAAAIVHQASSLTVVLNSMRLLIDAGRWRSRWEHVQATCRRRWRQATAGAAVVAAATYVLTGVHAVRVGEVAVVQRFGKLAGAPETPGLQYRLPYPFGRHRIVRIGEQWRVEVGFRTVAGASADVPAYEWNVQHRAGRTQAEPGEADLLTGDENLVDVRMIAHYRIVDPLQALFTVGESMTDGTSKWDALVRGVAEAGLRAEMSRRSSEAILASQRAELEAAIRERIAAALDEYRTGLRIEDVCLGDVHPPVEVVPAYREVAGAQEEKEAQINEAEAYQFEAQALARGQSDEKVLAAQAFREERTRRAQGSAGRLLAIAKAAGADPALTRLRLYLQTIEQLLAGRRKIILDRALDGGHRRLFLEGEGVRSFAPGLMPEPTPPVTPTGENPRP